MLRNKYKQAKTKYEPYMYLYALYYHYMDLFSHVFHMFFSYLITEILILEYNSQSSVRTQAQSY